MFLGFFRVIFLFHIVLVLCDCITFVTTNAKYLCTFVSLRIRVFLERLLFKVEKPPFCTVLRLIVHFRRCASPVE